MLFFLNFWGGPTTLKAKILLNLWIKIQGPLEPVPNPFSSLTSHWKLLFILWCWPKSLLPIPSPTPPADLCLSFLPNQEYLFSMYLNPSPKGPAQKLPPYKTFPSSPARWNLYLPWQSDLSRLLRRYFSQLARYLPWLDACLRNRDIGTQMCLA